MKRSLIGLVALAVVALIAVAVSTLDLGNLRRSVVPTEAQVVTLYYGGEKSALLDDPAITDILRDRYNITLDAIRAGSVEMAKTLDVTGKDCLWPSSTVAVDLARARGLRPLSVDTIFTSPIVFYAWNEVADAMVSAGLVRRADDGFLYADVQAVAAKIQEGAKWREDIGINLYGSFGIFSTDPAKSNSGLIWAGLLATAMNEGSLPVVADLSVLLPQLQNTFASMGYMESSSGDIFENFLKQGMGARPIIVGYENQMVEFINANAASAPMIRDRITMIYPEPTVFASHPLISLTPACTKLAEALQDPELQGLAWSDHGFRTGLAGVVNDHESMMNATLPETINQVVPMPTAATVEAMVAGLQ
jgi:hypothetical protein